jgi:hypothetical protein
MARAWPHEGAGESRERVVGGREGDAMAAPPGDLQEFARDEIVLDPS